MKLVVYGLDGKKKTEVEIPIQFLEEKRPDLIKKVVLIEQANQKQSRGVKSRAGMRASAELSRRRKKYRGSYGLGISRVPRKIFSRRGTRFNWAGAVAPGTVGGRKAHPPKASKQHLLKINNKENNLALRSGLSYVFDKESVSERGHKVPQTYPFLISKDFENTNKTTTVQTILRLLGFKDELKRASVKKIRAGKGKRRARPYKKKKGLLIVVSKNCDLTKAATNLSGVDVSNFDELNMQDLAPGTHPGRITLFTESAIDQLKKENWCI